MTEQVGSIMSLYLAGRDAKPDSPLFVNYRGEAMGRAGIAYVLQKHTSRANAAHPESVPATCRPHTLRHSKAMHMLEAGVNLVHIRDFLGHSSIMTTELYAKANPEMKREAIDTLRARVGSADMYSDEKRDELISWLATVI